MMVKTQGSNDTTHRLSRRTAATTRFNPWYRQPETDSAKVLSTSDRVGLYLASIPQMATPEHTSDKHGVRFNTPPNTNRIRLISG